MAGCKANSRPFAKSFIERLQSFARVVQFLTCLILLVGFETIPNARLASAKITLPVIRSFSKLEGSGVRGSKGMTVEHGAKLREHDYLRSLRHNRILATSVVDFPLGGNDYSIGLYYTEIGLGTPSQAYYVQVDTGSDLLWVNCKPCTVCPASSTLHDVDLRLYDPSASSTASNTSCSAGTCTSLQASSGGDNCIDNSCFYGFGYGDGSQTMGYLIDDELMYDIVQGTNSSTNTSARVTFGCGYNQSGDSLTSTKDAVDGIMGFGQGSYSVVSQLANDGLTTQEFAHCLQGDTGEGGTFVIGDIQEPGIVYTPMVPKTSHYNVQMKSITVGTTLLDIPSTAFDVAENGDGGTIFDSGTTLAILVNDAYNPFLEEITRVTTAKAVNVRGAEGLSCFEVSNNDFYSSFPNVTLTFDGASMSLDPTNYLSQYETFGSDTVWCVTWAPASSSSLDGTTILGDIVLKNKLVVYDLKNQQIGWVDYDCLSSVKVATGSGSSQVEPNSVDGNDAGSSLHPSLYQPIFITICSLVLAFMVAQL